MALAHGATSVQAQPQVVLHAPKLATKTVFAQGFGEPSGVACDQNGHLYVADEQRGEVVRLSLQGARFGVLAKGLQAPSGIVSPSWGSRQLLVCERGANRVIALSLDGKITNWGEAVEQPINIARAEVDAPLVISAKNFEPLVGLTSYPMGSYLGDGVELPHSWIPLIPLQLNQSRPQTRPQFSDVINRGDNKNYFLSEPATGTVWKFSRQTGLHPFAQGVGAPSGMALGKDGALYVCDQSAGGRLLRLDDQGRATVVATELGRPCAVLWANQQTAFVANRDGNIWKLAF